MMIIDPKFEIGQDVYVCTDEDQKKRKVRSILIMPGNMLRYLVSDDYYYDFELSDTKDIMMTSST